MLPNVATTIPDTMVAEEVCGTVPSSSPLVIPPLSPDCGAGEASGVVSVLGTAGVVSVLGTAGVVSVLGGVRPHVSAGRMADNGSISAGHSFCNVS